MTTLHTGRFLLRPFTAADEALSWFAYCDAARANGSAHEFGIFLDDGEILANLPSMAVARKAGAMHECLARRRLQLRGRAVDAHMFSLVPALD